MLDSKQFTISHPHPKAKRTLNSSEQQQKKSILIQSDLKKQFSKPFLTFSNLKYFCVLFTPSSKRDKNEN